MFGLAPLVSYALFVLVAVTVIAHKRTAASPLRSTARWLIGIAAAYGVTFGLTLATFLLDQSIIVGLYSGLSYIGSLYWVSFYNQGAGLALVLLTLGLVFIGFDWLRGRSTREGLRQEIGDISISRTAWGFTLLFTVNFLLAVFLLIEPYLDAALNASRVYAATQNHGLDPRDWFPFSLEGSGLLLYELAFWVWSFTAFLLLPLIAAQAVTLRGIWRKLQGRERFLHKGLAASAALLSIFTLSIGGNILYWLAD
jgi:hypothetical protein